ncbi:hypothetical protein F5Y19DRAFT_69352 [Xylariaceae sp. FL1651]|nr:hypothetical protein F5Y19DRAFT_69352 [Xylariaceae sp. FL1651]
MLSLRVCGIVCAVQLLSYCPGCDSQLGTSCRLRSADFVPILSSFPLRYHIHSYDIERNVFKQGVTGQYPHKRSGPLCSS